MAQLVLAQSMASARCQNTPAESSGPDQIPHKADWQEQEKAFEIGSAAAQHADEDHGENDEGNEKRQGGKPEKRQ